MRRALHRRVAIAIAVGVIVAVSAGVAYAGSITTPGSSPFNVPGDAAGNPQSFTVVGSGFPQGEGNVFIEQCDGVDPGTSGYSPLPHCDSATSPAAVDVGADGLATFPANDTNFGFFPFKGKSPQNKFNCIAPGETDPNNGKPTFTNCQVRVSTDNLHVTTDQAYLTMTLPTATPPTTTTTLGTGTTTSTATTSTTVGATTTTTIAPVQNPACDMGAGVAVAGKPAKNTGLIKISKGLLGTGSAKATKVKITGTLENCTNMPTAPKAGGPITSGSFSAQVTLPAGSTCSSFVTGSLTKTKFQVKWNALVKGKAKTVASDKGTIASLTQVGSGAPIQLGASSSSFSDPKSLFNGKHAELNIVTDETQSALNTACASKTGIAALHFTGVSGTSTLTVKP